MYWHMSSLELTVAQAMDLNESETTERLSPVGGSKAGNFSLV